MVIILFAFSYKNWRARMCINSRFSRPVLHCVQDTLRPDLQPQDGFKTSWMAMNLKLR